MKKFTRESILVFIFITSFLVLFLFDAICQDPTYHDFADQRVIFGIPNFFDVTTNISFALFGFAGFIYTLKHRQKEASWSWITFFFGVAIVSLGSGYYHLNPNNDTLVWDRLPMTIGFMGLFIAILSEYVNKNIERYFLIPTILLGFATVIYWHYFDDLRFYYWIQLIPLLTIPLAMLLFKGKYTHQKYLIIALLFYIFAKITEYYDKEIFALICEQLSGHSMKHLLASIGPLYIYLMLKKRAAINDL